MRTIILLTATSFVGLQSILAQKLADAPAPESLHSVSADTAQQDSLPRRPPRKLLPDNMSWMEKGMWGENGFFRGIGLTPPLTPEARKNELEVRRTMLTMHQIGGFVTLAAMGTAVWYGQQSLNHPAVRQYRQNHQFAVTATIISYSATGLLAAFSPPPLLRRDESSTTTIHKTLAWIHFGGMILTPILGSMLHKGRVINYGQLAHFHQASAYITTAALAASFIIITF